MSQPPLAIVTGAAGGIGRSIAAELAVQQWIVVVNDIDKAAATQTAEDICKHGGEAVAISCDIGDQASVSELFCTIQHQFSRPANLLVNNAAVQTWSSIDELSIEDWQKTINTNLTGCFLMTKHFAKAATRGSSIINIGSGCNHLAFPSLVDYTASKGGIEMFTKSAALELGSRGIRVNCIAPGAIATERTAAETGNYNQSWAAITPLQRIGTPEDIANAVLLLIDAKAGFITGQTINVDGGLFSRAIWPENY